MRLRQLELVRYGGYADRSLDFGDATTDLHLIVGPNEAGKSTLLSAIGDFLFGFPQQTTQDWRFDYNVLRVRAVVEQAGDLLEAIRRKGNKSTLLGPDGAALADDALSALIAGVDRPAFERLFGLDHTKLRIGGQAILDGRDDAGRALLEAGAGLASVTAELKRLDARCAGLFKPSASVPEVNRLLRERSDALKIVRESSLSDADLTRIEETRARAESRRAELITESETLTARANAIERVKRTRGPLGRLAAARASLAELGPLPLLPPDAQARLRDAQAERATARELRATWIDTAQTATAALSNLVPPEAILRAQARIEALSERRSAVEKAMEDRPRRLAELDRIDTAIDAARREAGLAAEAVLPSAGWRRRARHHLESWRMLEQRLSKLSSERAAHRAESARVATGLSALVSTEGLEALQAALAGMPLDGPARLAKLEAQATRVAERVKTGLSTLGWRASTESLAGAPLPSPPEAVEHGRRIDQAAGELKTAQDAVETALTAGRREQRNIEALIQGAELPTAAAIASARDLRDERLAEVRRRLGEPRSDDDDRSGADLAEAVLQADTLVDRRDGEAQRLAEHAVAVAALAAAGDDGESARRAVARWTTALAEARATWAAVISEAGLPGSLLPAGFDSWRDTRERVLDYWADAIEADAAWRTAAREDAAAGRRLNAAFVAAGGEAGAEEDGDRLVLLATARVAALTTAVRSRETLIAEQKAGDREGDALGREVESIARAEADLGEERRQLEAEAGGAWPRPALLEDALAALDAVVADAGARAGVARQLVGIDQDVDTFAAAVAALLADLGRPPNPRAGEAVRGLARDLAAALETHSAITRLTEDAQAAALGLKSVERRLFEADAVVAQMRAVAGASDENELDAIMSSCGQAAEWRRAEAEALVELADLAEGLDLAQLEADANALSPDKAAADQESITGRRKEIDAEREAIGRALAETEARFAAAATATAAANAQQAAAEAGAALVSSAERYVESATAAALLKWLVDRHRATAQGPLLARASLLFAQVTGGSFQRLALDYDDDDRPRIVAARPDGSRVGVEGLSEGTRDQLFLALRLSSLQGYAQGAGLPLVCDDLLITSDDDRAGAILTLLRAASSSMQVLVFTHHEHIVDVASRALGAGAFRLHRLDRAA
jgi:uncharacterized protein YhaN